MSEHLGGRDAELASSVADSIRITLRDRGWKKTNDYLAARDMGSRAVDLLRFSQFE